MVHVILENVLAKGQALLEPRASASGFLTVINLFGITACWRARLKLATLPAVYFISENALARISHQVLRESACKVRQDEARAA